MECARQATVHRSSRQCAIRTRTGRRTSPSGWRRDERARATRESRCTSQRQFMCAKGWPTTSARRWNSNPQMMHSRTHCSGAFMALPVRERRRLSCCSENCSACAAGMGLEFQMAALQAVTAQHIGGNTLHHSCGISWTGHQGAETDSQSNAAERLQPWLWPDRSCLRNSIRSCAALSASSTR